MNTSCTSCVKQLDKNQIHYCKEHCGKVFCWGCLNDHALNYLINENKSNVQNQCNDFFNKNKKFENINTHEETPDIHPLMSKGEFGDALDDKDFYSFDNFEFSKIANKNQSLGAGAFGDVYLAKHKIEDKKYAIKVMNKAKLIKNKVNLSDIRREIMIHSKLNHPYIIKLKNHHEDEENFYMMLEYAKNGTLYAKLKKMKSGLSEETAFKYFIQSCSAIYFLHKNKLAHRDIKPENLLLDDNNNIKLADFGWCDYFSLDANFYEICGTYEYMAPEIVKEQPYTEKVDNWSLGVLLYELLHGKSPFYIDQLYKNPKNTQKLFSKILNNDYKLMNSLSTPCKDLIKSLLQINASNRLELSEIFSHEWVINKNCNFRNSKKLNSVIVNPNSDKFIRLNRQKSNFDIQGGFVFNKKKKELFNNDRESYEIPCDDKRPSTPSSELITNKNNNNSEIKLPQVKKINLDGLLENNYKNNFHHTDSKVKFSISVKKGENHTYRLENSNNNSEKTLSIQPTQEKLNFNFNFDHSGKHSENGDFNDYDDSANNLSVTSEKMEKLSNGGFINGKISLFSNRSSLNKDSTREFNSNNNIISISQYKENKDSSKTSLKNLSDVPRPKSINVFNNTSYMKNNISNNSSIKQSTFNFSNNNSLTPTGNIINSSNTYQNNAFNSSYNKNNLNLNINLSNSKLMNPLVERGDSTSSGAIFNSLNNFASSNMKHLLRKNTNENDLNVSNNPSNISLSNLGNLTAKACAFSNTPNTPSIYTNRQVGNVDKCEPIKLFFDESGDSFGKKMSLNNNLKKDSMKSNNARNKSINYNENGNKLGSREEFSTKQNSKSLYATLNNINENEDENENYYNEKPNLNDDESNDDYSQIKYSQSNNFSINLLNSCTNKNVKSFKKQTSNVDNQVKFSNKFAYNTPIQKSTTLSIQRKNNSEYILDRNKKASVKNLVNLILEEELLKEKELEKKISNVVVNGNDQSRKQSLKVEDDSNWEYASPDKKNIIINKKKNSIIIRSNSKIRGKESKLFSK